MPPPFSVLVVDDESALRSLVAEAILAHPELELVGEARDAETAAALVRELAPDVTLVDVVMPRTPGTELVRRLRAERAPTSFVLMSGMPESEVALQAARVGAASFVDKSRPPAFIAEVALAIARRWDGLR